MYLKARCPVCGTDVFHNIRVHTTKNHTEGDIYSNHYIVTNIELINSQSEDELLYNLIQKLKNLIYDGIEIEVLAGILEEGYGVTEPCCRDLIEKIKLELDMYCPDMKKLYFVYQDGKEVLFD